MSDDNNEHELLRSVAQQNAEVVFVARQRADDELVRTRDALREQSELLRVTLASIGDAVITTDTAGMVVTLNAVATELTGWTQEQASGSPLVSVFRIINAESREPVESPTVQALAEGRIVALASHTVLIARGGVETPIDDSAAPIRDADGHVRGAVLVFRSGAARKAAEDALRTSERNLADSFEHASVGMHWIGPDGIVLRANRAELTMLGYTSPEYVGHHITEFHADADVIADMLQRLAAGETLIDREARLVCKDGTLKHVLIDASVLWQNGKFMHTRGFTRDITDRKQAEAAQQQLAAIVESSQDAIISKTLDSRIVSWNSAAERLFGYTREEVIGRSITLLIPAERIDEEREITERLSRNERIEHYETVRVSKQGRRIDISLTISPISDSKGVVVGASKIARDITARKAADEARERSERTTRFLADASAALSGLMDSRSTLTKLADLAVPFFADWCAVDLVEPDGTVRRLTIAHRDPAKREAVLALVRRRTTQRTDKHGIMKVLRDGTSDWMAKITDEMLADFVQDEEDEHALQELRPVSYICTPLRSHERTIGVLTFVTAESNRSYDASDLVAAEDLAHRAAIAVENATLLEALKDSDRRKDEFLAMLAHELRNPLAPIGNAVHMFRAATLATPELEWATDVIDRQVHQMTRLVDDLLDVSRITRGKIELRRGRILLSDVVNGAVEATRPLVQKWGHELHVSMPPEPIHLDGDPARLAQVLSNLLNNAAKYTEHGGTIWVTADVTERQVNIRVKDTGIGIAADMLPRVFELFVQADSSLERAENGLGIGLALVDRLVEMHGGTVRAYSEGLGHGSEFVVTLPIAAAPTDADETDARPDDLSSPRLLRVLVVDDNRDAADSLGALLRMMGHTVHAAHDGLEAVSACAEFRPDVVLLDIGLPKLNGYEAARRIRRLDGGAGIMLVAITGWGQEGDRRRSREAGFNHHLTKPVEFAELQSVLAKPKPG